MNIEVKDGKVEISISGTFDANELRELLKAIGQARAQIADDPRSPKGVTVNVHRNPVYWIAPSIDATGVMLLVRDPCYGWLAYDVPAIEAVAMQDHLAGALRIVASATAAPPGVKNLN